MHITLDHVARHRQTLERSVSAPAPSRHVPLAHRGGEALRHRRAVQQQAARLVWQRCPHAVRERQFDTSSMNKVFAAAWVSEHEVLLGTKCNRLFLLDVRTGARQQIVTEFWHDRSAIPCDFESRAASPIAVAAAQPGGVSLTIDTSIVRLRRPSDDSESTSENDSISSSTDPEYEPADSDSEEECCSAPGSASSGSDAFRHFPPAAGRVDPAFTLCEPALQLLANSAQPPETACAGIHAIAINPSHTLVAIGGGKPVELTIYSLPTMEPVAVLNGHRDLVFSLVWLDDATLATGSRDTTLRIWRLVGLVYDYARGTHAVQLPQPRRRANADNEYQGVRYRRVHSPVLQRLLTVYAPVATQRQHGHKVRSLAALQDQTLASLGTDGVVRIWNVQAAGNGPALLAVAPLPHTAETVCLAADPWRRLAAVGGQRHLQFLDVRSARPVVAAVDLVAEQRDWGVRSLAFAASDALTVGGGGGGVSFYDVRAGRYLSCPVRAVDQQDDSSEKSHTLRLGDGHVLRDSSYYDYFHQMRVQHAAYALAYPRQHHAAALDFGFGAASTVGELLVAGGPLQLHLSGSYVGLWR